MARWLLVIHPEVREWLHEIRKTDRLTAALIGQAIQHVIDGRGPDEGRPLVDRIKGSQLHHLKELRPASMRLVRGGNPTRGGPLHRAPGCAE